MKYIDLYAIELTADERDELRREIYGVLYKMQLTDQKIFDNIIQLKNFYKVLLDAS
jgi:hypothetical protein